MAEHLENNCEWKDGDIDAYKKARIRDYLHDGFKNSDVKGRAKQLELKKEVDVPANIRYEISKDKWLTAPYTQTMTKRLTQLCRAAERHQVMEFFHFYCFTQVHRMTPHLINAATFDNWHFVQKVPTL